MRLPPPEPSYYTPNIPFGLQNLASVYREATISQILTKSEKDLDSLLLTGQEQISGNPIALATDQAKSESEEGKPISPSPTIKSTLGGQTIHCPIACEELHYQEDRLYPLHEKKKALRTH